LLKQQFGFYNVRFHIKEQKICSHLAQCA